jgi:RND superfamily putative drug exporter
LNKVFAGLGRFSIRFRYLVVLVWLAGTVAAVALLPGLSTVSQSSNQEFLPVGTPTMRASALASPFNNINLASSTLVVASNAPLSGEQLVQADRLETAVGHLPHVVRVVKQGESANRLAEEAEIEANVSTDGTGSGSTLVKEVRHLFPAYSAPGLRYYLTGQLADLVDQQASTANSQTATEIISVVFILALLFIAFRSLLAPLLTFLPAGLVFALAGPVITLATHIGVKVSSATQEILIVLVLGAGTDYGLFLVFRVREELRRGLDARDAILRGVATVGESITFSALTVISALMSLLLAKFGLYQSLGPPLAIGIALMLLAGLTLLPALLAIFGRAVFWPSRIRPIGDGQFGQASTGGWARIGRGIVARPATVLVVGLVIFGALAYSNIGIVPTGFAQASSGPPGSNSAAGAKVIAADFPYTSVQSESALFKFASPVIDHPSSLVSLTADLRDLPGATSVVGPLDPLGAKGPSLTETQLAELTKALGPARGLPPTPPPSFAKLGLPPSYYLSYLATSNFISPDGRTVQFSVISPDANGTSASANSAVPGTRAEITRLGRSVGAAQSGLLSSTAFTYDIGQVSSQDLHRIIPTVMIFIFILLALVLRSLIAPLFLAASVALSYLAALGLTGIIFVRLGTETGLNFILPFIMFVFVIALGSDYNILIMTRIREEAAGARIRDAVSRAVGVTGTTITTAGVVLGGTFAVLVVSAPSGPGSSEFREIGLGLAVGVLLDTFLVRTVLVPATVSLVGRFSFWPSKLARTGPEREGGPAHLAGTPVRESTSALDPGGSGPDVAPVAARSEEDSAKLVPSEAALPGPAGDGPEPLWPADARLSELIERHLTARASSRSRPPGGLLWSPWGAAQLAGQLTGLGLDSDSIQVGAAMAELGFTQTVCQPPLTPAELEERIRRYSYVEAQVRVHLLEGAPVLVALPRSGPDPIDPVLARTAVSAAAAWWWSENGSRRYPSANRLLIATQLQRGQDPDPPGDLIPGPTGMSVTYCQLPPGLVAVASSGSPGELTLAGRLDGQQASLTVDIFELSMNPPERVVGEKDPEADRRRRFPSVEIGGPDWTLP